jgi:hypothetical protein
MWQYFWGNFPKSSLHHVVWTFVWKKHREFSPQKNHWPEVRSPKKERKEEKKDSQISTSGFNI